MPWGIVDLGRGIRGREQRRRVKLGRIEKQKKETKRSEARTMYVLYTCENEDVIEKEEEERGDQVCTFSTALYSTNPDSISDRHL